MDGTPDEQVMTICTPSLPRMKITTASDAGPAFTSPTRYGFVADHDSSFAVVGEGQMARTVPPSDVSVRALGSGAAVVVGGGGGGAGGGVRLGVALDEGPVDALVATVLGGSVPFAAARRPAGGDVVPGAGEVTSPGEVMLGCVAGPAPADDTAPCGESAIALPGSAGSSGISTNSPASTAPITAVASTHHRRGSRSGEPTGVARW